jgi:DNA-binding NarL/FixJ family response regulator
MGEGYEIILAGEGRELIQLFIGEDPPDVLILDPDIPSYLTKTELLKLLHSHRPAIPIVIHTLLSDEFSYSEMPGVAVCVEKGEDVGLLKQALADVLHKYYPPHHSSRL